MSFWSSETINLHQITKWYQTKKLFKPEIVKLRIIFGLIEFIKTIYDMGNEKKIINHYNEIFHILVCEKLFQETFSALSVFESLNNNICLCLIDSNEFFC